MGFEIINGVLKKYREESGVTQVVIPDSVTSIGDEAFSWCSSLTAVTIPDSVTSIGDEAFSGCSSLTAVTIPDSVTSIGDSAFDGCESLTAVSIPDSVTSIGDEAFSWCSSLTAVSIPDSVTSIGYRAFDGCSSLTAVNIPDSVTSIGNWAFSECKSLTAVTIGNSVTSIGYRAFSECKSLTAVTIPDSVTSIGWGAFDGCSSLTAVTIGNSVTSIGSWAFDGTPFFDNDKREFVIYGKVLYKYKGNQIHVTIPDSVTSIGEGAFYECKSLTAVTIPDSVTSIGWRAFYECKSLTAVTIGNSVTSIEGRVFSGCSSLTAVTIGNSVTSIEERAFSDCKKLQYVQAAHATIMEQLDFGNPLFIETNGETYRFYALACNSGGTSYNDFIKANRWNDYDLELINNGPKYKYTLLARLFGGLDRLLNPVDLTDENRQLYGELLKKNVKKMIAFAEEIKCSFAVKALIELGIVDDSNSKAIRKLITASAVPEIAALAEMLGSEPPKTTKKKAAPKKAEPEPPADPLTAEYREKLTAIKGNDLIKKMKLVGSRFPKVKLKDGTNAPEELFRFIIVSYGMQNTIHIDEEADKAAGLLSYESLCEAISAITNGLDLSLYPSLLPVVCRFGNTDQIKAVIKYYDTLSGAKGKSVQYKIESTMALSDTRVAVLWMEKQGFLYRFAAVRNITEEQVYDQYLFDFGFDEQGKRVFDLGVTTIEVTISPELTLKLFNTAAGKTVRSIPKKGVAPDVQKQAADALADMRATLKKSATIKKNQLYIAYLEAEKFSASEWTEKYTKNPFLYAVAHLLVWSQDGKTFTLSADKKPIDAEGNDYTITKSPIILAHPMEMDKADTAAWQKYFTDHQLKQPFMQIWEPVTDKSLFKETRYKDCLIRDYYLKRHENMGINMGISIVWDGGTHTESHYLSIKGFYVDYDRVMVKEEDGEETDRVEITFIKPQKWNRRVNMVLAFLDKITVYGRIKKDDITVMTHMDRFTLPTIIEFITMAQEAGAVNVTAALLAYRNNTYPDYNIMDEFVLDF